jgi:hypothetical protein
VQAPRRHGKVGRKYVAAADETAFRKLLKLPSEDLIRRFGQEDHCFCERVRQELRSLPA